MTRYRVRWAGLGLLLAAGLLCAQKPALSDEKPAPAVPAGKGYDLHEWGVFTAIADAELANADLRAEWDSLPKFVYGQIPGRSIPAPVVAVKKPVIYFHADEPVAVKLRVDFPEKGLPAVWWPATTSPADIRDPRMLAPQPTTTQRHLEWSLHLQSPFKEAEEFRRFPTEPAEGWFQQLRDVKADDVYAWVGGRGFGYEREKFVYYDGLIPLGRWAEIRVSREQTRVHNTGKTALLDVTAVEVGDDGRVKVARQNQLAAGAIEALTFKSVDQATWPKAGADTLTQQLTAAGLHADEAAALVKIWSKDLFQTSGLTVFYRLAQEEYDRLLPLTATPAPRKLFASAWWSIPTSAWISGKRSRRW
jgi:hypothetical protein